ncbi:TetR/AcrR family transcriptional regulator [Pseudahrensia aquimaris]|uniref:TetR/AcrR family transcriptional regulator n=1 Tax=Pseudahrensia aquimaris TaxID=744461 RepID=A0ABW3FB63_9HYPH
MIVPAGPETYLEQLAAHVMQHGLQNASLRPLANAAGTSDRMLIYHFGSKDRLVAQIAHHIASIVRARLNTSLPQERAQSRRQCAEEVMEQISSEGGRAFLHVWFDMLAMAEREGEVYRSIAGEVIGTFHDWLLLRLPLSDPDPEEAVQRILVWLEGNLVLKAAGSKTILPPDFDL